MDTANEAPRFELTRLGDDGETDDGTDVVTGLAAMPKTLPCKYFYDARGSELFEDICTTPEYYPTRTERAILEAHADEIAEATGDVELVELGSGSAVKTRVLLDAYSARGPEVHFVPIDVSGSMLEESSRDLVAHYDDLFIRGIAGTYEEALEALHPAPHRQRMFLFLGSTIGNFTEAQRARFLTRVFNAMAPGDWFLMGFDRVKDRAVLEAAYNDAQGYTAAFNLNMLTHLNARFHGDFDIGKFRHHAFFNKDESRIEMHLVSEEAQTATLRDLDFRADFSASESIHTEISRKFAPDALANELAGIGFRHVRDWSDARGWFSLMLSQRPLASGAGEAGA